MRHDIVLEGSAFRLRPVSDSDATFILKLRTNAFLNRFLHTTDSSLQSQLQWLAEYYKREGDWYFVVERCADNRQEGLISLYDHNATLHKAEWGRWILLPGSRAAIESAWLIYNCAFTLLNIREVYCRTVAENASVISFHDSCGISKRKLLSGHFDLNNHVFDAVEHCVDLSDWRTLGPRLKFLAEKLAGRMQNDN